MRSFLIGLILMAMGTLCASADDNPLYSLHFQGTVVPQGHGPFTSPYQGPQSLSPLGEFNKSYTTTLFAGYRLLPDTEVYINPEITAGRGISGGTGLGAYANGEINRVGNPDPKINLARIYVSQVIALSSDREPIADDVNQVSGTRPSENLRVIVGIFALTDFFDTNTYSHDPRSQFLNWCFMDNCTWDYASNAYGYSRGVVLEWKRKTWALRASAVEETAAVNSLSLDTNIGAAHGLNAEFEKPFILGGHPGVIRLLFFYNRSMARTFQDATTALLNPDLPPPHAGQYSSKVGGGLNLEQELTAELGLFARVGASDGETEAWSFTDADRTFTSGVVLKGTAWSRENDRVGFALGFNQLTAAHANYLAQGGVTVMLGDGRLDYAPEEFLETYYSFEIPHMKGLSVSPDLQALRNPGYNSDRGPVIVYSGRVHYEW